MCHVLSVSYVPLVKAIRSQEALVYQKKTEIGARSAWATSKGRWLQPMLIASDYELYNRDSQHTDLRMSIVTISKRLWPHFRWLRSWAIWPFLVTTLCLQGRNAIHLAALYNIFPAARLIPRCFRCLKGMVRSVKNNSRD